MKDEAFIKSTLQKGKEAKEKAMLAFSNMSPEQLNWKPSAESWSIAQCLEHLIIADSSYFPDLKKITEGTYKMGFWEKYSPFTGLCGRLMKDRMHEKATKKMIAPEKICPVSGKINYEIIELYHKNVDLFLGYISKSKNVDLDKAIIASTILQIVTYSLRDALEFLVQHEHRHINQAERVKENEHFPR